MLKDRTRLVTFLEPLTIREYHEVQTEVAYHQLVKESKIGVVFQPDGTVLITDKRNKDVSIRIGIDDQGLVIL